MGEPNLEYLSLAAKDIVDNRRLLNDLIEKRHGGWKNTMREVFGEMNRDLGWLMTAPAIANFHKERFPGLVAKIGDSKLESLDHLQGLANDSVRVEYVVVRFLDIFSEKYDMPYVWRGGSVDDLTNNGLNGTYTFNEEVARGYVMRGFAGVHRNNPCLYGLPVSCIVSQTAGEGRSGLMAEHGYDGMFSMSFDGYIRKKYLDGLMIYV